MFCSFVYLSLGRVDRSNYRQTCLRYHWNSYPYASRQVNQDDTITPCCMFAVRLVLTDKEDLDRGRNCSPCGNVKDTSHKRLNAIAYIQACLGQGVRACGDILLIVITFRRLHLESIGLRYLP